MRSLFVTEAHPTGTADVTCPHCGARWNDDGLYDEEYGYFVPEDGAETFSVRCFAPDTRRSGRMVKIGCAGKFTVKRIVKISVTHAVQGD